MTSYEILDEIIVNDMTCNRVTIDAYFDWCANSATLAQQIELELAANDFGTEYTTKDGKVIRIID